MFKFSDKFKEKIINYAIIYDLLYVTYLIINFYLISHRIVKISNFFLVLFPFKTPFSLQEKSTIYLQQPTFVVLIYAPRLTFLFVVYVVFVIAEIEI